MKSSLKIVKKKTKITFLLSKTFLFFFNQKYIFFFLKKNVFKKPKNSIALAFFLLRKMLKNIEIRTAEATFKIPQFCGKATDSYSPSYFTRNRHPEVTKNPYYVLFPKGSQKRNQVMD